MTTFVQKNKATTHFIYFLSIIIVGFYACSATKSNNNTTALPENNSKETITAINTLQNVNDLKIAFYNLENLFDTINDPTPTDDDFTPTGKLQWTSNRYQTKLKNLYKVLKTIENPKDKNVPAIIGVAEVENESVLKDLIQKTDFPDNYGIVHHNSPDERGIDVGLFYNQSIFALQKTEFLKVTLPNNDQTREIAYAQLINKNNEILHVFVNHWPSRRGGVEKSEGNRLIAAKTLRQKIDQIIAQNPEAKIVIMGDLNDTPINNSLVNELKTNNIETPKPINAEIQNLYNLSYPLSYKGIGTHNFEGKWEMYDQIIVSGSLLLNKGLHTKAEKFQVVERDFMMYPDKKYNQPLPSRTYEGIKYHAGYSDHLPVCITLYNN